MYVIYSKPGCSYCEKAKDLLDSYGLFYEERILDMGQEKDPSRVYYTIGELQTIVPNVRTVPQVFFAGKLIGGYSQLKERVNQNINAMIM